MYTFCSFTTEPGKSNHFPKVYVQKTIRVNWYLFIIHHVFPQSISVKSTCWVQRRDSTGWLQACFLSINTANGEETAFSCVVPPLWISAEPASFLHYRPRSFKPINSLWSFPASRCSSDGGFDTTIDWPLASLKRTFWLCTFSTDPSVWMCVNVCLCCTIL